LGESAAEDLTVQFYDWEMRGRGWLVWDSTVDLEPPFQPFRFHSSRRHDVVIDDGRKPTFLSTLADNLKEAFGNKSAKDLLPEPEVDVAPSVFSDESEIIEFAVTFPSESEVSHEYAEHFLLSLSSCSSPVSYEILGTQEKIMVQFACRERDVPYVKQQIRSFFPDAIIQEGESFADTLGAGHMVIADCGLSEEFMRPLRTYKNFNPDALTTIFGALENLEVDEVGLVQVLFKAAESPWASSILRSVKNNDGSSFFIDAPEMVDLAEQKIGRPLFSVIFRLVGQSPSSERSWDIVRDLHNGLHPFTDPLSNELIPLTNDDYDDALHLFDVKNRTSHRSGMLLNSDELLGLVHLPSSSIHSSKLKRDSGRTQAVPVIARGGDFVLGENFNRDLTTEVSLSIEQRIRHIHVIGKTGTGKSTLLLNMIKQDIEAGRGVAVLDPHGDLVERIEELVPDRRLDDVILFDPSDTEYPVGFNILEAHSDIEQTVLSSDLVEIFRRFSTSWGDQMTTVLSNAIEAVLGNKEGGTLIELKRFLLENDFRRSILRAGADPAVVYFWEKEYPLLRGGSQISIITRLDAILRSKIVRNIVAQREGLDFRKIIESGKIFLAKLPQGIIGEENSHLLGSLICSKLHQAVMGRQSVNTSERTPFFLYIDEFQNFATPSMVSMLSGSRKYAFGLVLAHQDLHQIGDAALANSVITNPSTRICFALGDNDAQKLTSGFTHFDATDLMNLGTGESIVRVERSDYDFNLKTYEVPLVPAETASMRREKIMSLTRERYGHVLPHVEIGNFLPEREKRQDVLVDIKQAQLVPIEPGMEIVPKPRPSPTPQKVSVPSDYLVARKDISQHRYFQTLIKKMAEQRGYRAVIEEPTGDGGRVDVGLKRHKRRIAVEISVTTGDAQELHNIEKCLKAGYDPVIVCSSEKRNLEAIRKLMTEKLPPEGQRKVFLFEPEELFFFLDEEAAKEATREERVNGYRVKVQYQAVSSREKKQKRDLVAQVMLESMRRIRSK